MAKRQAGNYLTDQNWDQEEESEEPGEFTRANDDTLKTRKICKAKRKTESEEASAGAFKGFAGFSSGNKPSGGFGFGPSSFSGFSNGKTEASTAQPSSQAEKDASNVSESKPTVPSKSSFSNGSNSDKEGMRSKYLQQLKALNTSVTKWIKEHVDKNPYCLLMPIFKDYEKHVADLEKKFPNVQNEDDEKSEKSEKESQLPTGASTVSPTTTSGFSFKTEPLSNTTKLSMGISSTTTTTTSSSSMFKFNPNSAGGSTSTSSSSTFGSGMATGIFGSKPAESTSGFPTFGGASTTGGFSFASSKPSEAAATSGDANTEEEEYVPPKPEVDEVKEDGAFYTKRCKLFYKKGDSWQERGLGNLHLKPCNQKTQLIVRADTSLGNILLNIMLSPNMPVSRQGKNNVAIVCVPNPPIDEKKPDDQTMTPMLIRVKTGEDADTLFEKIKEHKS